MEGFDLRPLVVVLVVVLALATAPPAPCQPRPPSTCGQLAQPSTASRTPPAPGLGCCRAQHAGHQRR